MKEYVKVILITIILILISICGCIEDEDGGKNGDKNGDKKENLPPNLTFVSPYDEEWIDYDVRIEWIAVDPENDTLIIDIYYGKDDNWNTIASDLINASYYEWDVSSLSNEHWILKIEVSDGKNTVSEQINITIHNDFWGIFIISPEKGEVYSKVCNISWNCIITPRRSPGEDLSLYYTNDNGTNWNFIAGDFPISSGQQNYSWNISGLTSSKYYKIKIHSDSQYVPYDVFSDFFEIKN